MVKTGPRKRKQGNPGGAHSSECAPPFVAKGNPDMVIIDSHGVYQAAHAPPALVRLAHIRFAETEKPACRIPPGKQGKETGSRKRANFWEGGC